MVMPWLTGMAINRPKCDNLILFLFGRQIILHPKSPKVKPATGWEPESLEHIKGGSMLISYPP